MDLLLELRDECSGRSQRSVVHITARQGDSVADLKRRVRQLGGLPGGSHVAVLFNGQRLDDSDSLDKCGVAASRGSEQWADGYVYPNGWSLLGHKKAYPKVGSGCAWVPLRSSEMERAGARGAWALLLLVCLCNTLLALLLGV